MSSRINIFPHLPNQSVLSTPTDTTSCAAPVSLSIQVLPDSSLSPPPQSIRYFYAGRYRILRPSHESVRLSSARFVRFPCATPTPLTATLLSISILVGGGGFVTWSPSRTSDSASPMSLSVLVGGVVVDTWSPSHTPNFSVYVRPGEEGWF